jgi:hypothetical protein
MNIRHIIDDYNGKYNDNLYPKNIPHIDEVVVIDFNPDGRQIDDFINWIHNFNLELDYINEDTKYLYFYLMKREIF